MSDATKLADSAHADLMRRDAEHAAEQQRIEMQDRIDDLELQVEALIELLPPEESRRIEWTLQRRKQIRDETRE